MTKRTRTALWLMPLCIAFLGIVATIDIIVVATGSEAPPVLLRENP